MGAAMQGGVGGHAGLFSNAEEVYKLCKCIAKGKANGYEFITSKTLNDFNNVTIVIGNRRGVGFDKPS